MANEFENMCECGDLDCWCKGGCLLAATITLYRVDMNDKSGTAFCEECAADAHNSGLYVYEGDIEDVELEAEVKDECPVNSLLGTEAYE